MPSARTSRTSCGIDTGTAGAAVREQSELAYYQHFGPGVGGIHVHFAVFVLEHAQTRYFAGEQRSLFIGISLGNAEQDVKALPYLTDGLSADGNF